MAKEPGFDPGEREFLAAYDPTEYPGSSVAVDVAIVTAQGGELRAILVKRGEYPQRGSWALPGGFVGPAESLDAAAVRVLNTKADLHDVYLEQLYTFGDPERDPRTRVIAVAYYALVNPKALAPVVGPRADVALATLDVPWKGEAGGAVRALRDGNELALAFDHDDMLGMVVRRLRGKLNYAPIGFELLPRRFTLRALQEVHETILDQRLNKDSFRRRMLGSGLIVATGTREKKVGHRPAALYRFAR